VVLALLAAVACAGPGARAQPTWLHKVFTTHLIGRPKIPAVARYQIDSGGAFILDRSAPQPLLKFEDSPEVFALTVSRGPRGDVIYSDDIRQPVMRLTKAGGATIFTARRPEGSAAALAGSAPPIRLTSLGAVAFIQRFRMAALRARQMTQRALLFEAPNVDASSDALIADAATVTTEALASLAARPAGRGLLTRFTRVDFVTGVEPAVKLRENILLITVNPALGLGGRPSSLRIQQALGASPGPIWIGVSP
jgi:hypothetical protein